MRNTGAEVATAAVIVAFAADGNFRARGRGIEFLTSCSD
jgi:hypothetical protein